MVLVFTIKLFRTQKEENSDVTNELQSYKNNVDDLKEKEIALDNLIRKRQMELEFLSESNSKYPFSILHLSKIWFLCTDGRTVDILAFWRGRLGGFDPLVSQIYTSCY